LLDSIRKAAKAECDFRGWSRLVDYRYSNQPLSMAGSLKGDGGRFNIGAGLNPANHTPFPALYVAEDFPTAFRERFGLDQNSAQGGITANELVLRRNVSFTQVALDCRVEMLIDAGDLQALKPIAQVLALIQMPRGVGELARKLQLRSPWLVRTASSLQRMLLHPNWRIDPVQYELPSSPQIFGRMCSAAGVHGILYPSVRNGGMRCLALYPQNWRGSGSFIELIGSCPPEISIRRLDGESDIPR
jgi:RES domain-containing protein